MSYIIGSFNLRRLSYSTKDEELGDDKSARRDYAEIGRIIREQFDVVALQEVLTENVLQLVFPSVSGWTYRWKQTRSKQDESGEGYAFAWNTRKLRLEAEPEIWIQHQQDPVLGPNGLLRYPFYGRFTPCDTLVGGPFCEFRLINTHIRFNPKENRQLPASTVELRQREFKVLTEQILYRLTDERRYGNNKAAYTFLMGDYNLNLTSAPRVEPFVYVYEKKLLTVQDTPTTIRSYKETDPSTGEQTVRFDGYANNYDHFTYDQGYFESRGIRLETRAVDTVSLYRNGDFEKHWREISDHIPIALEVKLR